jgi:diacylglycerol kinase (ATP)
MNKISIIFNPNAGNKQINKQIDKIQQILAQKYETVDVYITNALGDGAKYVKQIEDTVDLIIGIGGDGTIYELINAICTLKRHPKFAIIPGGTCNDFSRAIGMSQNPMEALEQILVGKRRK